MPRRTLVMAMLTQSVGVPSTAYTPSANRLEPKGPPQRQRVADRAGFGERRDDRRLRRALSCASASALMPSECTPSSLVTRIRFIYRDYRL